MTIRHRNVERINECAEEHVDDMINNGSTSDDFTSDGGVVSECDPNQWDDNGIDDLPRCDWKHFDYFSSELVMKIFMKGCCYWCIFVHILAKLLMFPLFHLYIVQRRFGMKEIDMRVMCDIFGALRHLCVYEDEVEINEDEIVELLDHTRKTLVHKILSIWCLFIYSISSLLSTTPLYIFLKLRNLIYCDMRVDWLELHLKMCAAYVEFLYNRNYLLN